MILGKTLKKCISSLLDWCNRNKGNVSKKLKKLYKIHPMIKEHFPYSKVKLIEKYHSEHSNFGDFVYDLQSAVSMLCLIFGIIPFCMHAVIQLFPGLHTTWYYLIVGFGLSLVKTLMHMPVSYYSNFVIEAKYGFNRMTTKLFLKDSLKGFLLGTAITGVMITLINYFMVKFGPFDWIDVGLFCAGVIGIGLIHEFLSMTVFLKMFNKLSPLTDKKLKKRIKKLLQQYGYSINMVYVMDSSKRSTKANAFIGGWGKSKKIVLFDTLLKNFTNDEIISILGHELAHGKKHHLIYSSILSYSLLILRAYVTFWFIYDPELYQMFGFSWIDNTNVVEYSLLGLMLTNIIFSSIVWVLDPVWSWLSRIWEYQADEYSVKYTKNKKALISALVKLSSENMSDIFPDKFYEIYYYSHPSLSNRVKAINKIKEGGEE